MRAVGISVMLAVASLSCVGSAGVITGIGPFGSGSIDFDRDGQPDLTVSSYEFQGNTTFRASATAVATNGLLLAPLTPGSTVDGSTSFGVTTISESAETEKDLSTGMVTVIDPGGSVEGDYGFVFSSQGAPHYGWAHIHVSAEPPPEITLAFVAQWAYESDPNTPITVGAVPEPASAGLLLLAAPAVFRRRRPPY